MAGKDESYDSLATKVFMITMIGAAIAISAAFIWTML
jgi:hypothetical protein